MRKIPVIGTDHRLGILSTLTVLISKSTASIVPESTDARILQCVAYRKPFLMLTFEARVFPVDQCFTFLRQ